MNPATWLKQQFGSAPLPAQWHRISDTHLQLLHNAEAIPITIRKPAAARSIKCSLRGTGFVITAPARRTHSITTSLMEFEPWMRSKWQPLHKGAVELLAPFGTQGILRFDQPIDLQWQVARHAKLVERDDGLIFEAPEHITPKRTGHVIAQYLESHARQRLNGLLQQLAPTLPRLPIRVAFKNVSSLWGSMTQGGALSLERSLTIAPAFVFDYIVVHELCHLIEMNHSDRFWAAVEQRMPNYRQAEYWLKHHGAQLRFNYARTVAPDPFIWQGPTESHG